MLKAVLADAGLLPGHAFHRDGLWWGALAAAVVLWLVAWQLMPQLFFSPASQSGGGLLLLSLIVWQPLLEEMLFRGVVQGQAAQRAWGKVAWLGVSGANLLASALFAASHLVYHAPGWAAAVLVPALVFGFFRDRYGNIWPGTVLHVFYNAGYFLIGVMLNRG